jgi:hypothetical protein
MPVLALPWRDTKNVHRVNLLERPTVRLANEKVNYYSAGETAACKDVAVAVVDGGCNVRSKEGDQKVEDPVRGD